MAVKKNAASVRLLVDSRVNNFDMLRLFAAVQVALYHALGTMKVPLGASGGFWLDVIGFFSGVPIFFVISGFLLTLSYDRNSNLKIYSRNRFLRIYPALIVSFIVSLIILASFGRLGAAELREPTVQLWIFGQMSFGQFYCPEILRGFGSGEINGSLWTITIELQFYVVLPLVLSLVNKLKSKQGMNIALLVLFLASVAVYYRVIPYSAYRRTFNEKIVYLTIVPHLHMFLVGVFIARNFNLLLRFFENKILHWSVIFLVFMFSFKDILLSRTMAGCVVYFFKYSLLGGWAIAFAFSYRSASKRILKGNDISYGVYIYHMIIVNSMIELGCVERYSYFAIACILTVTVAVVSWKFIEKPALRLKRRH